MKKTQRQSIIELARAIPSDDRVPYAFEKRIMAHIRNVRIDPWAAWSGLMWRAAVTCVAISLCAGILAQVGTPNASTNLVASDLEEVVFAPILANAEGDLW